jgi:hypothetical protein
MARQRHRRCRNTGDDRDAGTTLGEEVSGVKATQRNGLLRIPGLVERCTCESLSSNPMTTLEKGEFQAHICLVAHQFSPNQSFYQYF